MHTSERISPAQVAGLITSFILGSAILLIPQDIAAKAGRDAWVSMLLATLIGLGVIYLYTTLALKFVGKNFIQYSEIILGKILGKVAGLLMIFMALELSSLVVRDFGVFFTTTILPNTPILVINMLMVFLVVISLKSGIGVLARVNMIIMPPLLFFLVMLTIMAIPNMEFKRLLPMMENGFKPVFRGTLSPIGFPFAETALFTMIIPHIGRSERVKKAFLLGGLAGGFFLLTVIIWTLLVISSETIAQIGYPVLEAVRLISLFHFVERVDALIIINWLGFGFIKITICFYALVTGLAQWFNLKDYRPLILPAGIVILALSLILFDNQAEAVLFIDIWVLFTIMVGITIPLLLLIVAGIRGLNKK